MDIVVGLISLVVNPVVWATAVLELTFCGIDVYAPIRHLF
jgi:hypothetical protein